MTHLPDYAARAVAALLFWLALVLWGSAIANFFPISSSVVVSACRFFACALAPLGMVGAFWVNTWGIALTLSMGLALGGGLLLAMQV